MKVFPLVDQPIHYLANPSEKGRKYPMSMAQQKKRFLALIAVLVLTALTISLTMSGGLVHLGTALWHFINRIVTDGPDTMSHWF